MRKVRKADRNKLMIPKLFRTTPRLSNGPLTTPLHSRHVIAVCHEIARQPLNLALDPASGERLFDHLGQPAGIRIPYRVAAGEGVAEAQDAEGRLGALLGSLTTGLSSRHGLDSIAERSLQSGAEMADEGAHVGWLAG